MFSKNELLDTIEELEDAPKTFQNIQKLATFYSIYDHLYRRPHDAQEPVKQTRIEEYGDSEFLQSVAGADTEKLFLILDELMETVKVLQPRLYDAALQRIKEMI